MAQPKERQLFRVEYDGSTYYATGAGAFDALASCVAHDNSEGNFAGRDEITFTSIDVAAVGTTSGEEIVAWSVA